MKINLKSIEKKNFHEHLLVHTYSASTGAQDFSGPGLASWLSFENIATTELRCHIVRTVISSHSVYNFSDYLLCLP